MYKTTFVDVDSVHHYKPRNAGLYCYRRPTAPEKGEIPLVLGSSEKLSEFLRDNDCFGPPSKEPLKQFDVPAPDLDGTQSDLKYTSNRLKSTRDHGHSSGEDDNFSPAEKLLPHNGEAQEYQRTGLSDGHMMEGPEGSFDHTPESDHNNAASPRSSEDEHQDEHSESICRRNRSAAYSSLALMLNSENAESHAEDFSSAGLFTDAEPVIDTDIIEIRDSFKRTADIAELDEDEEGGQRLGKTRRQDPIIIENTEDEMNGSAEQRLFLSPIKSTCRSVFRRPFQQLENTTILGRSSEVGGSQDDPIVVDDEENTDEIGSSTGAMSMGPGIGIPHLESFHPKEQPKTYDCWSPSTIIKSIISPSDHPNSHGIALFHDRVDHTIPEDNRGAAATIHLPQNTAITSPLLQQSQVQGSLVSDEQWEIIRIVDKRQSGNGYEYKVCWKETWLPECELGNAQELLREFEFQMPGTLRRQTGKNGTCR